MTSRREFLAYSAGMVGLGVVGLGGLSREAAGGMIGARAAGAAKPLRILILGGTGFLGPAVIDAAQARGHTVTIFNRGQREKFVGTRDHVEKLYGNRDPDKHAEEKDGTGPKGLDELKGKTWDGVVDTSGFFERIVKASAELLAPSVGHYVFISTLSVYKNNDKPNMDESDAIDTVEGAIPEDLSGQNMRNYGPAKARCELAAEAAMPGRVTNLRAGYIVGPGDTSDRFTYWPVRTGRGGEVLVPGTPDDAVQIIDVRDLAEFVVRCIETKAAGVMNACGPAKKLTNGEVMAGCLAAAGGKGATFTYVPYEWLVANGAGVGSFPILLPPDGETAGFHTRRADKAIKAGLVFRPVGETCRALAEWWPKAVALRDKVGKQSVEDAVKAGKEAPKIGAPDRLRAGPDAATESKLLAAWQAEKGTWKPAKSGTESGNPGAAEPKK